MAKPASKATVSVLSLDFVESLPAEDDVLTAARLRSRELGCEPVSPAAATTLRFLAASIGARAVVEVGTGAGISGLSLLRGMRADGVLTTVDLESDHQRVARTTFGSAGFAPGRFRLINGSAGEVLPRLTDGAYDLVFVDADKLSYGEYCEQAVRLLRAGGIVAFGDTLGPDRVADDRARDDATVAVRELVNAVYTDERLVPTLLPVGDGLLVALRL